MNERLSRQMGRVRDAAKQLAQAVEFRPNDHERSCWFARDLIVWATNLAETLEALDKAKEYGG